MPSSTRRAACSVARSRGWRASPSGGSPRLVGGAPAAPSASIPGSRAHSTPPARPSGRGVPSGPSPARGSRPTARRGAPARQARGAGLRDAPGPTARLFLPKGEVVVSTDSRTQGKSVHEATGDRLTSLPLVVLTPKSLLRHPLVASAPRELADLVVYQTQAALPFRPGALGLEPRPQARFLRDLQPVLHQVAQPDLGQLLHRPAAAEAARAIEPLCMLWCIPGFLRNQWTHAFHLLKK